MCRALEVTESDTQVVVTFIGRGKAGRPTTGLQCTMHGCLDILECIRCTMMHCRKFIETVGCVMAQFDVPSAII